MKTACLRLLSGALLALLAFQPVSVRAQDQHELNRQAERSFETADAELNKVYKELSGKMDKLDLEELKAAQRLWVQFRDAQAKYEADLAARDGSLFPTIYYGRRATLTKARIAELKEVLKGN